MKPLTLKDFKADWNHIVITYEGKDEQMRAAYRIIERFFSHIADECNEFLKERY